VAAGRGLETHGLSPLSFFSCSFGESRSTKWDSLLPSALSAFRQISGRSLGNTAEYFTDVAKCITHFEHTHFPVLCCHVWQHCDAQTRHRLTAVMLKLQVFWDVALCRWVNGSRWFEGTTFETSGTIHPTIQCHIPKAMNLRKQWVPKRPPAPCNSTGCCRFPRKVKVHKKCKSLQHSLYSKQGRQLTFLKYLHKWFSKQQQCV